MELMRECESARGLCTQRPQLGTVSGDDTIVLGEEREWRVRERLRDLPPELIVAPNRPSILAAKLPLSKMWQNVFANR